MSCSCFSNPNFDTLEFQVSMEMETNEYHFCTECVNFKPPLFFTTSEDLIENKPCKVCLDKLMNHEGKYVFWNHDESCEQQEKMINIIQSSLLSNNEVNMELNIKDNQGVSLWQILITYSGFKKSLYGNPEICIDSNSDSDLLKIFITS
jgi:hypothetical protein